jgi:hypothetical protein
MPKIRLILLSLLAAVATSMVVSAPASAALKYWVCKNVGANKGSFETSECLKAGGSREWETKQLAGNETTGLIGSGGPAELTREVSENVVVAIKCQAGRVAGILKSGGESSGEFSLVGLCNVVGQHNNCIVREPIVLKFGGQLTGTVGDAEIEQTGSASKESFGEIEIAGSTCAVNGKYKLEGKQTCKFAQLKELSFEREVSCTKAGSKLTLGGLKSSFGFPYRIYEPLRSAWGFDT